MLLLLSSSLLAMSASRASPMALRALRDLALTSSKVMALQEAMLPLAQGGWMPDATLSNLASSLAADSSDLTASLDTLALSVSRLSSMENARPVPETETPPQTLKSLQGSAVRLHRQVERQRDLLLLLDTRSTDETTRAAFAELDKDTNGQLELAEFLEGAAELGIGSEADLRAQLERRFRMADVDGSNSLDYAEFASLITALREESREGSLVGPLRAAHAESLELLLDVNKAAHELTPTTAPTTAPGTIGNAPASALICSLSTCSYTPYCTEPRAPDADHTSTLGTQTALQMTALTLSAELCRVARGGSSIGPAEGSAGSAARAAELAASVDNWCDLERRVTRLNAPDKGEAEGEENESEPARDARPSASPSGPAATAQVESLLLEVGSLAESLSLTNGTRSADWRACAAGPL